MKPRNKTERRYVALAERLPDISGKLIDWAKNYLFEDSRVGYLYRKTATVWCMCCGHVGRSSGCDLADALVYECPSCGKKLSVYKSHARQQMNEKKWFYVIDVFEGNQVIRMMQASRSNEKQGVQTVYGVMEIFQKWLDSSGKEIITSRPYSRSPFYGLSIRSYEPYGIAEHNESYGGAYYFHDMFICKDYTMYPTVKISHLLRRNGCNVRLLKFFERNGCDVFDSMKMLLTNNILETLVKAGHKHLALYYVRQPSFNMRDYLHAINVCTRNDYHVKDADLWLDYIHMLIITGMDSHNSYYVCPSDLREAHDRMMERIGPCPHDMQDNEDYTRYALREAAYNKKMQRFSGLRMRGKGFSISPIMTLPALEREGKEMSHCVFRNKYDRKNSLIMSVRARTRRKERIATVEVGLDKFIILQCRGKNNTVPQYHSEICDVINANMTAIQMALNG